MIISPCAMLMTPITPKVMARPVVAVGAEQHEAGERAGDRAAQAVVDADLVDRIARDLAERRQGDGIAQPIEAALLLADDDALVGGPRIEIAVVERLQRRDGVA